MGIGVLALTMLGELHPPCLAGRKQAFSYQGHAHRNIVVRYTVPV